MMRGMGRIRDELHEARGADGAVIPELPARPRLRDNAETGGEDDPPEGNGHKGFRERRCVRETARGAAKGGCRPFAAKR